jgi:hypothetical protein
VLGVVLDTRMSCAVARWRTGHEPTSDLIRARQGSDLTRAGDATTGAVSQADLSAHQNSPLLDGAATYSFIFLDTILESAVWDLSYALQIMRGLNFANSIGAL